MRSALLLSALLLAGCAAMRQTLGLALVPTQTEIALGEKLSAQVEKQEKVLADRQVQAYVRQVADPLVLRSQQDRPGIAYRVAVLDNPKQVNAFALPGGFIYVYSGLLKAAQDEAELAGVLAHEIGHVVGRHSANQLATRFGLDLLASLALGENPGQLSELAADLAGAGALARFSRDDERQADEYGFKYTLACGYDPRGLLRFFEKLQQMEKDQRSEVENLFSTHPPTPERIARIERMIEKAGNPTGRTERERFLRETASLRR